tara:strand:+ start:69201 stop:70208 length:1008 start_codon:yes stop_codon:yes gene_type:complete
MITGLGLIQQGLFFGFFITLLVSFISQYLYPLIQKPISSLNPTLQARIVFLWSILPILTVFIILFLALLPSLFQITGISNDHCLGHIEGHLHFCLAHRNAPVNSLFVWIPAIIFLAHLSYIALNFLVDICETVRFKNKLSSLIPESEKDIVVLDTNTPLALSCGLLKQTIYLSKGLLKCLTEEEKNIIIAHEKAHIWRRDALAKLFSRSLSLMHFPGTRSSLLNHLTLACEQSCDNAAAEKNGDNKKVAELLLKVERLYQGHFFTSSSLASSLLDQPSNLLPDRIQSLVAEQHYPSIVLPLILSISLLSFSLLIGHEFIHDALEHLIFLFTSNHS